MSRGKQVDPSSLLLIRYRGAQKQDLKNGVDDVYGIRPTGNTHPPIFLHPNLLYNNKLSCFTFVQSESQSAPMPYKSRLGAGLSICVPARGF